MKFLWGDLTIVIRVQRIMYSFLMLRFCVKFRYNWKESVIGLGKYLIAIGNFFLEFKGGGGG